MRRAIRDSLKNVIEAKECFGDDYEMYCGYCSQWYHKEVYIEPWTREEYMALDVTPKEQLLTKFH